MRITSIPGFYDSRGEEGRRNWIMKGGGVSRGGLLRFFGIVKREG